MVELKAGGGVEVRFLEHEHVELQPGIDRIAEVADLVGHLTDRDLADEVRQVADWLEHVLVPHAEWEEGWLYPELDRLAGTPWATRMMPFEHTLIRNLAARLEGDWDALRKGSTLETNRHLRAHLYGLHELVRAHVKKEERFLLPLLEGDAEQILLWTGKSPLQSG